VIQDKNVKVGLTGGKSYYIQLHRKKSGTDSFNLMISRRHEHEWAAPTYTWNSGNTKVTAARICKTDSSHKETETVSVTSKVTKNATYTAKGQTTYTATFKNSAFATQKKVMTNIPVRPKEANTIAAKAKVKANTVKFSKLKKKNQTITVKKAFTVSNAKGKVTYKVIKYDKKAKKKILVSKAGKVTVKKGLKKETYKVTVRVSAAGTTVYKAGYKDIVITVKVR